MTPSPTITSGGLHLPPQWSQERLFGELDLWAQISLGHLGSKGQAVFGASITSLESDSQVALWAQVAYPLSSLRDLAEQGVQEVLEVMYDLR